MQPASEPNQKVKRLLLVDDDSRLLAAFDLYLRRSIDVDTATSGEAALELLQQNQYSVIISDMFMPSMNGVEFIREAKEQGTRAVCILLTASRESQTAVDAYNDANVFMVVNKPCPLSHLQEFVEAAHSEFERNLS